MGDHNITFVDAPVSGGITGARAGTLAVMVSCPKDVYAPKVEPILKHFGKLFYTGEKPGLAQTAKLVNNLLAAAALVISSEGMAMGVKAGLDPKILLDIINVSSGRNSATQDKFPRAILPGTFDFGFATALSFKDTRRANHADRYLQAGLQLLPEEIADGQERRRRVRTSSPSTRPRYRPRASPGGPSAP